MNPDYLDSRLNRTPLSLKLVLWKRNNKSSSSYIICNQHTAS